MADNEDIGAVVQGMSILYDGKKGEYYLLEGNSRRRLEVNRIQGHFDANQRFHVDKNSGEY